MVGEDLQNLLADTSDLVVDVAQSGRILFANPAAIDATGYSQDEIAGLNFAQLLAPEFVQVVNQVLRTVLASRETAVCDLQLSAKSGASVSLRTKIRPLDSDRGAAVRMVGRDVTESVGAQLRVHQIEDYFRAAFQTSPDAVAINRLSDGLYTEVNDGFTAITGYSREETIGRSSQELEIWVDAQERAALVEGLTQNGSVQGFRAHFRRKGGRIDDGVMSARLITIDGELHILSVTRDMTDWSLAEKTLLERQASLEKAQQLSRTLMAAIEQAVEDITITDTDGNLQYCNPSFQRITGYSGPDVIGKNPRFLKSGHHNAEFYSRMWSTIKAGLTWTGRFTNRRRDGSLVVEDATISPISDPYGKPQGYVAVKRDVTQQLELEAKFYQAQKLESIGRLAGGVAHDFNNLLTVINGYSSLVLAQLDSDSPWRDEVEEIRKAGERAASLTGQLLAFSRKQSIEPKTFDLSAAVLDAEKMLRRVLGEDIALETRTAPGATVFADPGQIHQVLMNLAVNARDAMPGGGKLRIEVRIEIDAASANISPDFSPGSRVLLSVGDSGIGMDKEVLDRVFEPFFTTKEAGRGTGLGLATVYGIVQQNCGTIAIESTPRRGTTVRISLPFRSDSVVPKQPASVPDDLSGTETVMLVEDQEEVRRMAVRTLRSYGYQVLEARDGAAAVELAKRHPGAIDIVVTDVVMPVLGGRDLLEMLKTLRPGARVLLISGYWNTTAQQTALPAEAHYLAKPFTPESLAAKVRAVLDSSGRDCG